MIIRSQELEWLFNKWKKQSEIEYLKLFMLYHPNKSANKTVKLITYNSSANTNYKVLWWSYVYTFYIHMWFEVKSCSGPVSRISSFRGDKENAKWQEGSAVGKILRLNLRQLVKPPVSPLKPAVTRDNTACRILCRQFCSCNLSRARGSAETDIFLKTKTAILKTKQNKNSTTIQFCREMNFLIGCITRDKYVTQGFLGTDARLSFQRLSSASPTHD